MHDNIKKIIESIKNPLSYEPKNGYKDNTVIGGFSSFVINKITDIENSIILYEDHLFIDNLKNLFIKYGENPNKDNYLCIIELIKSIDYCSNLDMKIINIESCRANLSKPMQYIKGIGPKRAKIFEKLGIYNLFDLFYYFPRDYLDRSKIIPIRSLKINEQQTFQGKVVSVQEFTKNRFSILKVTIYDGTGTITGNFFNQKYLKKIMEDNINKDVLFSGKTDFKYGHYEIENIEYEFIDDNKETIHTGRIVPVYKLTSNIYPKTIRTLIKSNLDIYKESLYEFIPTILLKKLNLTDRSNAVINLHFPKDKDMFEKSRKRMVLEEFILSQFKLQKVKELYKKNENGISIKISDEDILNYEKIISFSLTKSQKRVLIEFMNDLNSNKPMNRLLHGDVGSGKTVVAAGLIYLISEKGYQVAFMAPTEILAKQSYKVITNILSKVNISTELLISDTKEKQKKEILKKLSEGKIQVIIGTHALIQENVKFHNLAAVIVDEQHRFGVKQREALKMKGKIPHMLIMSATPIPRTISMTRFGDLDISTIEEMPLGERKVVTRIILDDDKSDIYTFTRQELKKGEKVYVVCPLIDESETMDVSSSIVKSIELKKIFPEYTVTLLHGRMNSEEKDEAMNIFTSKNGNILVSTTVIEVGIDVSEASIIIIENSERFGLAQIHQLRGRIGRKSQQSYCFLIVNNRNNIERLKILEKTNSGFDIAEKDLEQRGPGELYGERQHGYITKSLIKLPNDLYLLEEAKDSIIKILESGQTSKLFEEEINLRENYLQQKRITEIV